MKKERSTMSDEQRERLLIAEQIERAKAEDGEDSDSSGSPPVEEGLKREEGVEKVVLSFSAKPVTPTMKASSGGLTLKPNPLKAGANPLKRPNVFKTAASNPTPSTSTSGTKRPAPQSAAERLMFEDQERKRRKMEREAA